MDVGIQMMPATYGWQGMSDDQAWDEEIRLAQQRDRPWCRRTRSPAPGNVPGSARRLRPSRRVGRPPLRVAIESKKRGGTLTLHYASRDVLDRVLHLLRAG
jgi:hypothetical protein